MLAKPGTPRRVTDKVESLARTVGIDGIDSSEIATSITVPKRELGPVQITEVLAAYRAGEQVTAIAKRFGIHRATVHLHLSRAGEPLHGAIPRMDARLQSQACELYRDGLSLAKVIAKIGVPATTIKRALLANGVQLRPR